MKTQKKNILSFKKKSIVELTKSESLKVNGGGGPTTVTAPTQTLLKTL